jgi:hypothetical protein
MDTLEVMEQGTLSLRFVDVRGLNVAADGWTAAFLVYGGGGRAGLIEFEKATGYYQFTPEMPLPGIAPLGDFSIDVLRRRVADWLAGR